MRVMDGRKRRAEGIARDARARQADAAGVEHEIDCQRADHVLPHHLDDRARQDEDHRRHRQHEVVQRLEEVLGRPAMRLSTVMKPVTVGGWRRQRREAAERRGRDAKREEEEVDEEQAPPELGLRTGEERIDEDALVRRAARMERAQHADRNGDTRSAVTKES